MDAMSFSPHEPLDDLVRVLGYVDAIDQRNDMHEVANEMFAMSCWTPQFCQALIRAAEVAGGFAAEPGDPVPGHEISLAMISPRLFEAVQNDMGERIWPQLQQHWPLIDYHGINDAFIIKYQQGGQEELRRQGANNSALPVGSLLAWPSLVTHPHHSTRITKGTKYSLTIWFELPLSLS